MPAPTRSVGRTFIARAAFPVLALLTASACASRPAPGSAAPSANALPSIAPTSVPSMAPSPSGTPAPPPSVNARPVAWSAPAIVDGLQGCTSVVLAVDETGGDHLASDCGDPPSEIRYASSTDGTHWTTTTFKAPANRLEQEPVLAFDGSTFYLAYTRLAPEEGGCGADGLADVGVWYRTRTLPAGPWSSPQQIGSTRDHLQAFRVSGSVIHATVANEKDGKTWYEIVAGGATHRYELPGAAGSTALRVGDDGRARIAFEGAKGIVFGTFNGGGFKTGLIPGSTGGFDPTLALAPGNTAELLWSRAYHGIGCAEPGPQPEDGTYFATNAGGTWATHKLSGAVGATSLIVDPATGELHALIIDGRIIDEFDKRAGAAWRKTRLSTTGWVYSPVIRQDPTTGGLVLAYVSQVGSDAPTEIAVMNKG